MLLRGLPRKPSQPVPSQRRARKKNLRCLQASFHSSWRIPCRLAGQPLLRSRNQRRRSPNPDKGFGDEQGNPQSKIIQSSQGRQNFTKRDFLSTSASQNFCPSGKSLTTRWGKQGHDTKGAVRGPRAARRRGFGPARAAPPAGLALGQQTPGHAQSGLSTATP